MKIDVHADDYALSLNTSMDILKVIGENKLDSVSILPNMNCFEDALILWKQQSERKMPLISIHLNFVEGHCCADSSLVEDLIDHNGYLVRSWGELFRYSFLMGEKRDRIKQQFKAEIKAQIEKIVNAYEASGKLRIDSHQHTHMIPIIFESLMEVISQEKYSVEYIRDSHDLFEPYLKQSALIKTYRPINMVKVMLLNLCSVKNKKKMKKIMNQDMFLSGVFLSGKMDGERISRIMPAYISKCERKNRDLEVLFHPGTLLEEETGAEFVNPGAVEFYQSTNRNVEWKALMEYPYWGRKESVNDK